MKARIFTTTVLMIVALAAFAQTSRRGEREREKSTRTEENKNNDSKQNSRTESRRSERKVETKSENNQSADYQQTPRSRRENTGNNQNSGNEERKRESNRGNQDNDNKPANNANNSNAGNSQNDTKYRPIGNQGNNDTYKPGESRRSDHNDRVAVNPPQRREYVKIEHNRRKTVVVNHPRNYRPVSVQVRREYHPYRAPIRREIVWSIEFRNNFRVYYPEVRYWRYEVGYRLPVISAYDTYDFVGDVARVYGKAFEVYYEYETDEYYLYFGDYYPYHDFSVIVPGHEARKISRRPERLFRRSHIEVTGYITEFDNKPEMIIRNARQIDVY